MPKDEIKPKTVYKSPDGKLYYVLTVNGSSAQVVECTIKGGKVKRVFGAGTVFEADLPQTDTWRSTAKPPRKTLLDQLDVDFE
jgi:hypothetical protein